MKCKVVDLGRMRYADALKQQQEYWERVKAGGPDTVLLVEHEHVYTFGKSADHNNLLIQPAFLEQIGAEVFETDRGGDITYHGPGQLVGYPIIDLRRNGLGVRRYVEIMEESLIQALAAFDIHAYQIPGLVGIWVGEKQEIKRKIGAIGIRVKQGVSMHGFALNIHTDLNYFNHIVPCGITDKSVTSIQQEIGGEHWTEYGRLFLQAFEQKLYG